MEATRDIRLTLANLLVYPDAGIADDLEHLLSLTSNAPEYTGLNAAAKIFREDLDSRGLEEIQELYTTTFDLDPVCSPYVGYHLFGEAYKRGALMAQLKEVFRELSLDSGDELPDHIAWILRYLAMTSDEALQRDAIKYLLVPALDRMTKVFQDTPNPYAQILQSLLELEGRLGYGVSQVV